MADGGWQGPVLCFGICAILTRSKLITGFRFLPLIHDVGRNVVQRGLAED